MAGVLWPFLFLFLALVPGCTVAEPFIVPPLRYELAEHWPRRGVDDGPLSGRIAVLSADVDLLTVLPDAVHVRLGVHPLTAEGAKALVSDGEFYHVSFANDARVQASGPHFDRSFAPFTDGYVAKYRMADHTLVATVRVPPRPERMVLVGTQLALVHFDLTPLFQFSGHHESGDVAEAYAPLTWIDTASMTVTQSDPLCIGPKALELAGERLYVACFGDEVIALDAAAHVVARIDPGPGVGTLFSPFYKPQSLAVVGADVWVGMENGNALMVFDRTALTFDDARTITIGAPVEALTAAGDRLYVGSVSDLIIVDPASGTVVDRITLGACGEVGDLKVNDGKAYVICGPFRGDVLGSSYIVDLATRAVSVLGAPSPSFAAVIP